MITREIDGGAELPPAYKAKDARTVNRLEKFPPYVEITAGSTRKPRARSVRIILERTRFAFSHTEGPVPHSERLCAK